jgi:archaemetzincin
MIIMVVALALEGTVQAQKIYIVPIDEIERKNLENLREELEEILSQEVRIIETQNLPKFSYNPERQQYHSTPILKTMKNLRFNREEKVLGIVDVDLYVPQLNFVFGEADPENGLALISLIRLRQEYYGLPKDDRLFHQRAVKEAVHELGHTFGLSHCPNSRCVMHFSNSLLDTDKKDSRFCQRCQRKMVK